MAGRFAVEGSVALAGDSMVGLRAIATARPHVYYIAVSSESNPADDTIVWEFKKNDGTGPGTYTAVTPLPLDSNDEASDVIGCQTFTVEPTNFDAVPYLRIGQNQRSVFQWYAQEGGELILPKTVDWVIAGQIISFASSTPTMSGVMHFKE